MLRYCVYDLPHSVLYVIYIASKSVLHIPIMHADDVHVRIEV